jgi:shikimate kinase
MISDKGVSVCLQADLPLLWNRVKHKQNRPLLRTPDPQATLAGLLEKRGPIYAMADLTVTARPEYSIDQMAEKVLEALCTRPDVVEKAR